jgi:hypothetical protein
MSRLTAAGPGRPSVPRAHAPDLLFTGLQAGDDIVYSRIAVDRLNGKADVSNVQQTRSGFLLPLVISYASSARVKSRCCCTTCFARQRWRRRSSSSGG